MNLMISMHAEAPVAQSAMPSKTADPAAGKDSASFRDYLNGTATETAKKTESKPSPRKAEKERSEKNVDESKKTDDKPVSTESEVTSASTGNEACSAANDTNTDTTDGDTGDKDSSGQAGREKDKGKDNGKVVSTGIAALSGTPVQHQETVSSQSSSAETSGPKADYPGIPVNIQKTAHAVADKVRQDGTDQKIVPPSSSENTPAESTAADENSTVRNAVHASVKPVMPDTTQAASTESDVSPDTSLQQNRNDAEPLLNVQAGEQEKESPELTKAVLTDNRNTGEKEPGIGIPKSARNDHTTTEQVEETVLPAAPKTKGSDIPSLQNGQKGDAANFNSQGNPAERMQAGQKNDSTAAPSGAVAPPDGNQPQPGKNFMQAAQFEAASGKEIIAERAQSDIRKDQADLSSKTNEKSGELFSVQESNATAANGPKAVHQKVDVPDISRISREHFVITRKDNTSIELTIEPEGIGKLNIHLSLDKGAVHARIHASENIGRDFLDRNMNNILQTLSDDGINIGSFSIHLRDRRNEFADEEKGSRKRYHEPAIESPLPVFHTGNNSINIFV